MRSVKWSTARPLRRVRMVLGVVLVLGAIAATVYVLLSGRPSPARTPAPADNLADQATPAPASSAFGAAADELAPLAATTDPVAFATDVAHALFDWDTTTAHTLADHKGRLLAVADPTGVDSPGLVADVGAYLPSTTTWDFLATYGTRQWIEVTDAAVPAQWADVVAAAGNQLIPGMTAVTISGVRHRAGMWEDQPVTEAFDVAFTAVVVCEPTYPQCYLLRLSRLDEPLR